MTHGDHTLVPRRTRRPGARGAHAAVVERSTHSLVRRSSFAIAAALTSVALTTTAAVSLTGNHAGTDLSKGTTAAAEPTTQPTLPADPEVRSASAKAAAVLTDAAYVTREGDLSAKERKRVRASAKNLRAMLDKTHENAGAPAAPSRTTAASRDGDRTPLTARAAAGSTADLAAGKSAPNATAGDATSPANLAGTTTGALTLGEQSTVGLPLLETPLADQAAAAETKTSGVEVAGAKDADAPAATPSARRIEKKTASLQRLIAKADGDAVVSVKAGPTPEEIAAAKKAAEERRAARAARSAERAAAKAQEKAAARAAEAKEMARAAKGYANGQIPSKVLCSLKWASHEQLRCDAAIALEELNRAFRSAFGRNLDVTDGYRSYGEQVSVAASRGRLAAVPGTSNHGLGQAVDLSGGIQSFGSAEHRWMVAHAGKYGWKLPGWAQADGSKPEAWHWEYGTTY